MISHRTNVSLQRNKNIGSETVFRRNEDWRHRGKTCANQLATKNVADALSESGAEANRSVEVLLAAEGYTALCESDGMARHYQSWFRYFI